MSQVGPVGIWYQEDSEPKGEAKGAVTCFLGWNKDPVLTKSWHSSPQVSRCSRQGVNFSPLLK